MYAPAENIENFTGILVRRQYKPGQKYIQLIFETAEGMQLSLSRNLQMVRSLTVGRTYHVKGPKYALGEKLYIHEPIAVPVPAKSEVKPAAHRKLKWLLLVVGCIIAAGGAAGASYLISKQGAHPNHASGSQASATLQQASTSTGSSNTGLTTQTPAPAQTPDNFSGDNSSSSATQPKRTPSTSAATPSPATTTTQTSTGTTPPTDQTQADQSSTPPSQGTPDPSTTDPTSPPPPTDPGVTPPDPANPPTN